MSGSQFAHYQQRCPLVFCITQAVRGRLLRLLPHGRSEGTVDAGDATACHQRILCRVYHDCHRWVGADAIAAIKCDMTDCRLPLGRTRTDEELTELVQMESVPADMRMDFLNHSTELRHPWAVYLQSFVPRAVQWYSSVLLCFLFDDKLFNLDTQRFIAVSVGVNRPVDGFSRD